MDPFVASLRAVAEHGPQAPALVFAAGAISGIGPCGAPRLIAIAGIVAHADRAKSVRLIAAFAAGLVAAYAAFGVVAALLLRASQFSAATYACIAAAMGIAGIRMLWREERVCEHPSGNGAARYGPVFLLGASFALIVSPCCTPLAAAIVAYAGAAGDPLYGVGLLVCFALGHTLPLCGAAAGAKSVVVALQRYSVQEAASVVSGTLLLALAGYYGVLA